MAYMDVPPQGQPNGRTVVLFHGMNFAGFYWGGPIDALRKEGFRVVVPDQIGFGRSSKPIIPYNFHDMARNTPPAAPASEDRQGLHRRPLDGRHAGGALRDAVSRRRRARRHLQSRSGFSTRATTARGAASTRRTSATWRRPISRFTRASSDTSRTIRRRGSRSSTSTSADPLRMDAERRLAALRDGAGAARADDVPRSGRQRLGAHQGADAGVRRRRRQPGRTGERVPGAHEVHRRHDSERQRPAAPHSRARATCRTSRRRRKRIRRSSPF